MAGLPSNIKKGNEEADELLKQMVAAQKASENTEIPAPEPVNTEEISEAKKDAEPKEQEGVKKETEGIKVDDENNETWKHKYEVLIGKYNAEIPRISAENKDLKSQISNLQKAIEDIQSKVVDKETIAKNNDIDTAVSVIERELGTDVSNALNKILDSKTNNVPKQYEEKVSRLEQKVENSDKRQILTEKQTYTNTIKQLIPDLVAKNDNPKFLEFLSNVIPFSGGKTYEQRLHEADSQNDASGVAEIFNAFYAPSKSNGKKHTLEEITEPGKPKPGKNPGGSEKEIYSQKEIDGFYTDVRQGKYKNRNEERLKKEHLYFLAASEGRIRT